MIYLTLYCIWIIVLYNILCKNLFEGEDFLLRKEGYRGEHRPCAHPRK